MAITQLRVSMVQLPASRWKPTLQPQSLAQPSAVLLLPSSQVSLFCTTLSPQKVVAPATLAQLASQTVQEVWP